MVAEAKSTVIVFLEKMDADVRQRLLEVTLSFARALQDQKPTGHLVVKRNFQVYLLDIWTRRRAKWRDGKPHALLKKYQRDARSFKELTNSSETPPQIWNTHPQITNYSTCIILEIKQKKKVGTQLFTR